MTHKKNDFNSFIPAKITILRKFRSSCSQVNSKGYPAVQSSEKNRKRFAAINRSLGNKRYQNMHFPPDRDPSSE